MDGWVLLRAGCKARIWVQEVYLGGGSNGHCEGWISDLQLGRKSINMH